MPWRMLNNGTLWGLTDATLAGTLGHPLPRFFITGDGHRTPAFGWTAACSNLRVHFMQLMAQDRLCVHVEQHPEEVSEDSVPGYLMPLANPPRIFGWELPFYKIFQPAMEQCMQLAASSLAPAEIVDDVVRLDRDFLQLKDLSWQVGSPLFLQNAVPASLIFRQYYTGVAQKGHARVIATEQNYGHFLLTFFNNAMGLRTTVNNYIGLRVQQVINQYPNSTHLIACGDAHITQNNLSQYITTIPAPEVGVVDPSNR